MGFSERCFTERSEETPEEVEATVHDNRISSGGTFLKTKYWPSCARREY